MKLLASTMAALLAVALLLVLARPADGAYAPEAGAPIVAGDGIKIAVDLSRRNESLRERVARLERQAANLGAKVRAERRQKRWWARLAQKRKPEPVAFHGGLVAAGRKLQALGYTVGEHPAFGGVQGRHDPDGCHYRACAFDVNADHFPGGEMAALDRIADELRAQGLYVLWRTAGHYDHLHAQDG